MARNQYFVVLHEDEWKIKFNGEHTAAFPSQRKAIERAIDTAQNAGNSQVFVQGEDHQFRAEWTYGTDPYPPKG